MRVARHAGMELAASATTKTSATTPAKIHGGKCRAGAKSSANRNQRQPLPQNEAHGIKRARAKREPQSNLLGAHTCLERSPPGRVFYPLLWI